MQPDLNAVIAEIEALDGAEHVRANSTSKTMAAGLERPACLSDAPVATGPRQTAGLTGLVFDHNMARQFLAAVYANRSAALVLGFTQGRHVCAEGEGRFDAALDDADRAGMHLFFHVAALKPEWGDPCSHAKSMITTAEKKHVEYCPFLWLDCDATNFSDLETTGPGAHYSHEGVRISKAMDDKLALLDLKPFAKWRSGAGWQALLKLDTPVDPEEAERLVGKLHTFLGFDPVVRNCNRILRVPGSINWKDGKDGRVPAPCLPCYLDTTAIVSIDHVRATLANIAEVPNTKAVSASRDLVIDWEEVKAQSGWLQSAADLPEDFPRKGRMIIDHAGSLDELNLRLKESDLIQREYKTWSEVTFALAATFKSYGQMTIEKAAAALSAPLLCNRHVSEKFKKSAFEGRRAVTRALQNSHDPKCPPSSDGPWPDGVNQESGVPNKGAMNVVKAIHLLEVDIRHDLFRAKTFVHGHVIEACEGEISDDAVIGLRMAIRLRFGFYPSGELTRDMIAAIAQQHRFNPVLDWFSGLKWDGVKRLDKMMTTYFGADDTPYHRAIGRKHLCAMVRRAKQPGAKYDYVLTLDGPQSIGKSMFCEDLAVWPDLYADTGILADSPREAMEQLGGKWSIEIGELAGYGSSTRERIKAFITRKSERARAACAHFARDQLRSCVFTATKNPGGFLNDPTGERRWWIAKISRYDREEFLKDREQLFAEAVAVEPAEKLWLETPELKAAQAAAATAAKAPNDLVDELDEIEGVVFGSEERISIADVRERLGITKTDAARDMRLAGRIADAMAHLGWEKPSHSIRCTRLEGMPPVKGFRRLISDEERTRSEERDAAYARDSGPAQGVLGPWPTK